MFTSLQPDKYGWCMRDTGQPEIWCFIGGQGDYQCADEDYDEVNSNSLYLLRINSSDQVVVDHDFGRISDFGFSEFSNFTFITRNVFLIAEQTDRVLEDGSHPTARCQVHAFEFDDNNGSTDKSTWTIKNFVSAGNGGPGNNLNYEPVWTRVLIKDGGHIDYGTDYWAGNNNRYPGWVSGFTFVPPNSKTEALLAENGVREKTILAITSKYKFKPMEDNNHVVRIHRLDSNPEGIKNGIASGKYYADPEAWAPGADGYNETTSAWKTLVNWGEPTYYAHDYPPPYEYLHHTWRQWDWHWGNNNFPNYDCIIYSPFLENDIDHMEGWCSCDSKGNFYYGIGNWMGNRPLNFSDWYIDGVTPSDPYCYDCPTAQNQNRAVFFLDTMRVNADDTNGLYSGSTRVPMMYDRSSIAPTQGEGWPSTPAGYYDDADLGLSNPGLPYQQGDYSCQTDYSHWGGFDSGCHDIFGQTHHILGSSAVNSKDTLWLLNTPNQFTGSPENSQLREGILVVKPISEGSQVLSVVKHFPCKHGGASDAWDSIGLAHCVTTCPGADDLKDCAVISAGMSFRPISFL